DVGKSIIASALRDAGHRVFDLGADVRPATFLERAEETGARIVIVCAEMVATAHAVARVTEMFQSAGRTGIVLLVSGGPFAADPALVKAAGARGCVTGADEALALVAAAAAERDAGGDA
ncbi:MAG TPA: cobalamin-dependent protein, partial [Coriobacteriia bacterium]|nr:cobalamin-dependent protein [Coriobacteriia bacterium]